MNKYTVIIVGATGLVGRTMIKVLEERNFPVDRLILAASPRSSGKHIEFRGQTVPVKLLAADLFSGADLALFSAGGSISREIAPLAAEKGCVVIDNSSAWRMEPEVPLVVPEVNPEAIDEHSGIIANPNCSTIQMVVALAPLHRKYRIRRIVTATYQAVTGSGKQAVDQLRAEQQNVPVENAAYPHPIAENCLPHIDRFMDDNYTREEHKMMNETRKILADQTLKISATCVRVPVLGGHSEAVNVEFEQPFEMAELREILQSAPGVTLVDEPAANRYPMPINAGGKDDVFVGRLRRDPSHPNTLDMWIVSDNLRKGAATNAVQIAETLITRSSGRLR